MSHRECKHCGEELQNCECISQAAKKKERMEEAANDFIETHVKSPVHYIAYPIEVIDIIQLVLDEIDNRGIEITSFQAACLKDEIKYRLRAGLKGDTDEDIVRDVRKALAYMDFRTG